MALADPQLVLMSFPQRWDGAKLALNLLLVPSVDPMADSIAGSAFAFADHVPSLRAVAIPSLDELPMSDDPTAVPIPVKIVSPAPPVAPRPAFTALAAQAKSIGVAIGAPPPSPPAGSRVQAIRKALPDSYLALTGTSPNGALTTTTDEFSCQLRGQPPGPIKGPPSRQTSWGELISYALRQTVLATALGLRYELSFKLDPTAFAAGGWTYIELADTDPWAVAGAAHRGAIRLYAARIPPLDKTGRPVFAAVLFPVRRSSDPQAGPSTDEAISEADIYDSGFAQVVHVNQPTANDGVLGDSSQLAAPGDIGIQIGWDDEQVVTWTNRQLDLLNERLAGTLDDGPPLGVLGYRVDLADITGRPAGDPTPLKWESLMYVSSALPSGFGSFSGELMVEPSPVRLNQDTTDAWLPHYFANWRGGSLSVADDVPNRLLGKPSPPSANKPRTVKTLLSYGHSYALRVRLGDLTGGGPTEKDAPVAPGPAEVATLTFRRMVPPKGMRVAQTMPKGAPAQSKEPESLTVFRPTIGYPEVLYTGLGQTAANRAKIVQRYVTDAAKITPGSGDVAGLPDPDVDSIRITVEVRAPAHDVEGPGGALDGNYRVLYETERSLPKLSAGPLPTDPGLPIDIAYVDEPSIVDWASTGWPDDGPLVVPRGRDVQVRFEPLTRSDSTYFGDAATTGLSTKLSLRAEDRTQPALLIRDIEHDEPVRGFLFRRPPDIDAPPILAQLAQALRLVNDGLSLSAPQGLRVAFGASKGLRYTISGDAGTITFASAAELLRNWVVAIVVDLDRDWTWDGLAGPIAVERDGEPVGAVTVPGTLGPQAVVDPENWDRSRTRLVYFDAIDPHETTTSGFPEALQHSWTLIPQTLTETGAVVGAAGAPTYVASHQPEPKQAELANTALALTLPIAIPPRQIPQLASVGVALSPYSIGDGYASTGQRQRALWLELTEPIENVAGDALFARVTGHGADPLLYNVSRAEVDDAGAPAPPPPPLALDPELMRVIVPADSDDRAGLGAMTRLEQASDSNVRFLLPLPPGVQPDDPELFGFWTYELRVGHAGDPHAPHQMWWTTAQGRFGRPLRVAGVQHPAPPLVCSAGRVAVPLNTGDLTTPLTLASPAAFAALRSVADLAAELLDAGQLSVAATLEVTTTVIQVTAPFATPVLNGRPLVGPFTQPHTTLCFLLYAQVVQADGSCNRNVLLTLQYATSAVITRGHELELVVTQRDRIGRAIFATTDVEERLRLLGLPTDSPLSILAVELLPAGTGNDLPVDSALGEATAGQQPHSLDQELALIGGRPQRILRVSPLVPVEAVC